MPDSNSRLVYSTDGGRPRDPRPRKTTTAASARPVDPQDGYVRVRREKKGRGGKTVTVDIPEFAFDPDPVSIKVCDSVVWRNSHTQPHTSTGEGADGWTTGNLAAGEESDPVTFSEAGTRTYICALHPFMTGTVEVS